MELSEQYRCLWQGNIRFTGIPRFRGRFMKLPAVLEELEEGAKEVDVMLNGERVSITDSEIAIQEETAACFAGNKSAEEEAHIIQSRGGILLGE